jgi:hypothetical protein
LRTNKGKVSRNTNQKSSRGTKVKNYSPLRSDRSPPLKEEKQILTSQKRSLI